MKRVTGSAIFLPPNLSVVSHDTELGTITRDVKPMQCTKRAMSQQLMAEEKNLDRKIQRQKHEKGGWIGKVLAVTRKLLVTRKLIAKSNWRERSLALNC